MMMKCGECNGPPPTTRSEDNDDDNYNVYDNTHYESVKELAY